MIRFGKHSMLIVTDKGHSKDYKEYWIKAYDPNKEEKVAAFKIIVNGENVWNLIEKNKEYFTTYEKEGVNPWFLEQIENVK
jgi:hypothetical protein